MGIIPQEPSSSASTSAWTRVATLEAEREEMNARLQELQAAKADHERRIRALEATSADHERRTSANEAQLQEIKTQFLAIEAKLAAATTLHQIQALKVQSRQVLATLNV